MIRVLVLGATGMLGNMVYSYLKKNDSFIVSGTSRNSDDGEFIYFDAEKPTDYFSKIDGYDYIINCIGIIKPFCKDDDPEGVKEAIKINSEFPHLLKDFFKNKSKLIQIATDCVFSGKEGNYNEDAKHDALDVYGKTKSLGEPFEHILNIRCSIIGPEKGGRKRSLFEWFLSKPQGSNLKGFAHHNWNGITTLRFAKLCEAIIQEDKFSTLVKINHTLHYVPKDIVNKFELLNLFKEIFNKDYVIEKVSDLGQSVDRTLSSKFEAFNFFPRLTIKQDIQELRTFMEEN